MKEIEDFYVGYIANAPNHIAAKMKVIIWLLLIAGTMVSFLLIVFQRKFAPSNFEYGTFAEITGEISNTPVPHVSVSLGSDASGKEIFQTIILVSPGKAGADKIVTNLFENKHIKDKSFVSLKGYLIYHDARALLQISENDNDARLIADPSMTTNSPLVPTRTVEVTGEIVDPKCYLGVMKPGEGKAHRSCAIRCISGGMPAVLHVNNSGDYFLILDQDGVSLNQNILPLVGDQLTLSGQQLIWNDWKILKVNRESIAQLSNLKQINERVSTFENGISLCTMP